jgi:hypothetical protein
MKSFLLVIFLTLTFLSSCALNQDAAAGISNAEMNALTENFYWKEDYEVPSYAPGELEKRMDRSADPTLDGEYAEGQTTAILVALATVGDEHFAATLATRSHEVQVAVLRSCSFMWRTYPLDHPKTQAIAAKIQGEQDATSNGG